MTRRTVEDTPVIMLDDLRSMPEWGSIQDAGRVVMFIACKDEEDHEVFEIELETTPAGGGVCHWFSCPRCRSRRRNLHLVGRELACRSCHNLLYHEQLLPRSTWKREIGVPALRNLGGLCSAAG